MLIQDESPAAAPAAVSGTSQKLLQLLRKRLRQLARVTLVLAIGLAVAAAALAIWWSTSLNGLPDIGDPFDVAAFRAFRVPDDQNAFAFLRRASEKLTPIAGWRGGGRPERVRSSPGRSRIRRCGSGLGRIARRSSCFSRGPNNPTPRTRPEIPRQRRVMGGLDHAGISRGEQARRERRHGGRLGLSSGGPPHDHPHADGGEARISVISPGGRAVCLQRRLTDWATEPRTTTAQLHTALDEVLENEPKPEWDIFAVKYGYLELMGAIERPMPLSAQQEIEGEWTFGLGDMALSPTWSGQLEAARRLPPARARTQPARPAAALCPVPGARGNPRAAAAETGRLGEVLFPDLNKPDDEGQ